MRPSRGTSPSRRAAGSTSTSPSFCLGPPRSTSTTSRSGRSSPRPFTRIASPRGTPPTRCRRSPRRLRHRGSRPRLHLGPNLATFEPDPPSRPATPLQRLLAPDPGQCTIDEPRTHARTNSWTLARAQLALYTYPYIPACLCLHTISLILYPPLPSALESARSARAVFVLPFCTHPITLKIPDRVLGLGCIPTVVPLSLCHLRSTCSRMPMTVSNNESGLTYEATLCHCATHQGDGDVVFVAGPPTCLRRAAARDVCDEPIVRCLWSVCLWYSTGGKGKMKERFEHM